MTRQTIETNGLNRSPITDAFRSVPHNPCRWLSNSDGLIACMYVHVHMNRIHTVIKLFRSNIADCVLCVCVSGRRVVVGRFSRRTYHLLFYSLLNWLSNSLLVCEDDEYNDVCMCDDLLEFENEIPLLPSRIKKSKKKKFVFETRKLETASLLWVNTLRRIFFVLDECEPMNINNKKSRWNNNNWKINKNE